MHTRSRAFGHRGLLTICGLALLVVLAPTGALGQKKYVNFGSARPGGNWYSMGGGMSALLNEKLPHLNVVSEATGGTVENLRRMRADRMDIGMAHAGPMYDAWAGIGKFKGKPYKNMRAMTAIYNSSYTFVSIAKTGLRTVDDLAGKRVAVGPAGSGSFAAARNILGAIGVWGRIKKSKLTFADAGRALADRTVVAISQAGAPHPYLLTLEATNRIVLLTMSEAQLDKVTSKYPYYTKGTLRADAYRSYGKPYRCIFFSVFWIADKKVDSKTVYEILKVTYDSANRDRLGKIHKYWTQAAPATKDLTQMGVLLHPGAVRFFKERGVSIPTQLIQ